MNTRVIVSFAWVAGPPLATLIIGTLGDRAILIAIAAAAVLNIATAAAMLSQHSAAHAKQAESAEASSATGLEIPALLLIGRLTYRYSSLVLIASGCLAGIAYYTAMVWVSQPVVLVGSQVLDAWFFAVVAGVGLTLFQRVIPRPGLASGLFVSTRRLGAIASGAIVSFRSQTALGYAGVFAACAALTVLALVAIGVVARMGRREERSTGAKLRQPANPTGRQWS